MLRKSMQKLIIMNAKADFYFKILKKYYEDLA